MERSLKKALQDDQDDFDPKAFLAKVGQGRTVLAFHRNETVFSRETRWTQSSKIQKGRAQVVMLSDPAGSRPVDEPVPASLGAVLCPSLDLLSSGM